LRIPINGRKACGRVLQNVRETGFNWMSMAELITIAFATSIKPVWSEYLTGEFRNERELLMLVDALAREKNVGEGHCFRRA